MKRTVYVTVKLEIIGSDLENDENVRDILDDIDYEFRPADHHNETVTIREQTLCLYEGVDSKGNRYTL